MTTLLQEFEERIKKELASSERYLITGDNYSEGIKRGLEILEELKKKHGVSKSST